MSLPCPIIYDTTTPHHDSHRVTDAATVAVSRELFLDPTERFEVYVVKAAERPHYLLHRTPNSDRGEDQEEDDENDNDTTTTITHGLTDGCDIPEWRKENICGLSSRQISLLSHTVWRVGSGSTLFRRESQWPVILTGITTATTQPSTLKSTFRAWNITGRSPWEELYHKLMQEPPFASSAATVTYQEALHDFPYEAQNLPVTIYHAAIHWKAMCPLNGWTFQNLLNRFGTIYFRFSDTHGEMMTLHTYAKYIRSIDGGLYDDSPMAIYDSEFGNPNSPLMELLHEYSIPKCFSDDLFDLVEASDSNHPPWRWLLIGPSRSGTGMHVDPLWTNAWVTLLEGYKRWILFPPSVPPELIYMVDPPIPSVIWFHRYYDTVMSSINASDQRHQWKPVEILQHPGETVFVPNGWAHAVVNLSPTNVAITHNYASEYSLERIWQQVLTDEPNFAKKWYFAMRQKRTDLAQKVSEFQQFSAPSQEEVNGHHNTDLPMELIQ